MQKPFTGFYTDKQKAVRVPDDFFGSVLPQITSMLEMKVTLFLLRRLAASSANGSAPRMVSLEELEGDAEMRRALSLGKGPRPFGEALREGLELAVARGTVLQMWVREDEVSRDQGSGIRGQWFLLHTRENKAWLEALGKGDVDITTTPLLTFRGEPGSSPAQSPKRGNGWRVIIERPGIYALYEQNIGLLTPILAERLQEAEGRYPFEWIEAAFEEAVSNNKRNWRYIERILERWAAEGRGSGKDREPAERTLDPNKYTKGKYAFLFRPEGSGIRE